MLKTCLFSALAATLIFAGPALAQTDAAEATGTDDGSAADASIAPPEETAPAPKRARGRRGSEKDTDGTKAPNRFQTDTVIKSKYHLDGEPLEVDPD